MCECLCVFVDRCELFCFLRDVFSVIASCRGTIIVSGVDTLTKANADPNEMCKKTQTTTTTKHPDHPAPVVLSYNDSSHTVPQEYSRIITESVISPPEHIKF